MQLNTLQCQAGASPVHTLQRNVNTAEAENPWLRLIRPSLHWGVIVGGESPTVSTANFFFHLYCTDLAKSIWLLWWLSGKESDCNAGDAD